MDKNFDKNLGEHEESEKNVSQITIEQGKNPIHKENSNTSVKSGKKPENYSRKSSKKSIPEVNSQNKLKKNSFEEKKIENLRLKSNHSSKKSFTKDPTHEPIVSKKSIDNTYENKEFSNENPKKDGFSNENSEPIKEIHHENEESKHSSEKITKKPSEKLLESKEKQEKTEFVKTDHENIEESLNDLSGSMKKELKNSSSKSLQKNIENLLSHEVETFSKNDKIHETKNN